MKHGPTPIPELGITGLEDDHLNAVVRAYMERYFPEEERYEIDPRVARLSVCEAIVEFLRCHAEYKAHGYYTGLFGQRLEDRPPACPEVDWLTLAALVKTGGQQ